MKMENKNGSTVGEGIYLDNAVAVFDCRLQALLCSVDRDLGSFFGGSF